MKIVRLNATAIRLTLCLCFAGFGGLCVCPQATAMGAFRAEKGKSMTPAQSQRNYAIDGKLVTEGEYRAFLKTLKGQEKWYCEETKDGGITGWEAKDAAGRRYAIKSVSGGDNTVPLP